MNVSDASCFAAKSSFDFEECSAMEIETWSSRSSISVESTSSTTSTCPKDESIISLFSQSIEIFGNTMAPWPTGKSIPEQVAGIFITSELTSPKDESVQSRLEANKPQIQTKLRRSNSKAHKPNISQINEDTFADAQRIFNELEAIPIVTVERRKLPVQTSEKEADTSDAQKGAKSRTSRLQSWLLSLYGRSNSLTGKCKDEECGGLDRMPLKSILKKPSKSSKSSESLTTEAAQAVQKSAIMTEFEAGKLSSTRPKKSIKLRFDNEVSVCETFHKEDYCRQSLEYVARQLTPALALSIKKELNALKQEMEVHEDSRHLTQFYLLK